MKRLILMLLLVGIASPAPAENQDMRDPAVVASSYTAWCMTRAPTMPLGSGLQEEYLRMFCSCSAVMIVRQLPQGDWTRWTTDETIAAKVTTSTVFEGGLVRFDRIG
jgi:hypothetical protein